MAEFGKHCFVANDILELRWAYSYNQPNEILVELCVGGAPRAFALMKTTEPNKVTLSDGYAIEAKMSLTITTSQNYDLSYDLSAQYPQENYAWTGILAHVLSENGGSGDHSKNKERITTAGSKKN